MFKSYVMGYERTAPPCMVIAAPTTLESANRRQALRFATRLSAAYVAEADEVYAESSETVDLSLTGVQLLTGRLVPKGAIMSVTLELPDQTIIVSGKVAWSSFRGRRAAAGVQFTRISASAQASLAKFLADLERQGRRPVS